MASNRSYYRNCCEVNEEDVVDVLKKVKGMKDVSPVSYTHLTLPTILRV